MKTAQSGRDLIKFYEGLPKPVTREIKNTVKETVKQKVKETVDVPAKDKEGNDIVKQKTVEKMVDTVVDKIVVTKVTAYPPYICPAGYPTLGYGSRYKADGKEVTMKDEPVSLEACEDLLSATLSVYERAVEKLVKVPLTQNQFDALVSFVYNLGEANLRSSTLLKLLNLGDYESAANQFLAWNKARVNGILTALPGLTKRREAERALFLKPLGVK